MGRGGVVTCTPVEGCLAPALCCKHILNVTSRVSFSDYRPVKDEPSNWHAGLSSRPCTAM